MKDNISMSPPPLPLRKLHSVDDSGALVVETNVDIPLPTAPPEGADDPCLVRANVYRPKGTGKYPVILTYGPYGKDIHYPDFHAASWADVNPKHQSAYSAWETPDPPFWVKKGYVVVRADERGAGQSPGMLNCLSEATIHGFFDVVEWCADQEWSSGKVALLGVSYYACTQWWVAARRPRGLAAIVPWEGMNDYYMDLARHGGILCDGFLDFWWNRQVGSVQYGLGDRAARKWGPDTLEGTMDAIALLKHRKVPVLEGIKNKYRTDAMYFSDLFPAENIECPVLSVANYGATQLHLRGNVFGFMKAGSKFKYLRFISGRHDVPFYFDESVEVQKSFLDAFLKGEDDYGWAHPGKVPPVDLCLRVGNAGVNDARRELAAFPRRTELEWPLKRTVYTDFHLTMSQGLVTSPVDVQEGILRYEAPRGSLLFETTPFEEETEITGHPMAHLNVSLSSRDSSSPSEIDLFLTIRHYDSDGQEILYTGPAGEPVSVVKGWLRVSHRQTTGPPTDNVPQRNHTPGSILPVKCDTVYTVAIEVWPTNVIISKGHKLALEIASTDTHHGGLFFHRHPEDRPETMLKGWNNIHFGPECQNFLRLPVIP
ncbi:alpha/beta-hydrolase [Xylona heveae TC161]|uniref:Alpha/beta-hydrolase n=1 Tax=Xylona heveae (strain CBS 132557 / TC161) TaxID=1328760 RepID=A0A164ZGQ9_XYLHT|nr:alpha/beta-hydrolase [Xylona heveae TC161]KZF19086.1 alpha/beta-hydrolase [Xylona heveae TC161]